MNFKRLISLVLTLAMLCSSVVFADVQGGVHNLIAPNNTAEQPTQPTQEEINKAATGFIDIAPDAPYAAAVKKLVEYKIIEGYPDGTFKPEGDVTRAEMCKMINLTRGFVDFEGAAGFADVTDKNWYYVFALAAQKQGYIEGYEDKTFRGGNNITRQEVCAILNRLLKPMNLGLPVTINDAVANWARPHVELIVQNFIMPLEEGNKFRATENLKRHELATVLSNLAIGPVVPMTADVRFYVDGVQYGETQTVEIGNSAVVPEAPLSEDASVEFYGWRPVGTEDAVEVGSVIVTGGVDYEAVFVKKTFTLNFYSRGALHETQTVEYNSAVTAPKNPEAKGYDFAGWSLSENGKTIKLSTVKVTENIDFYAVFEKEEANTGGGGGPAPAETKYSVKFYSNGDLHDSQSIKKGDTAKTPKAPELEGYVFKGWSLTDGGEIVDVSKYKVTKKLEFVAVFEKEAEPEPEVYEVIFYVDGEEYDKQSVEEGGTPVAPSKPSKDGYNFVGWSKTEGGSVVTYFQKVTSNTEFHAVFELKQAEVKYYDVNFYVDGEVYDTVEVESGKSASAPASPSKEGYTFKGWSKSENGSIVNVSTVTITAEAKFYAVFEIIEHTVTFYVDDEKVSEQKIAHKDYAQEPSSPSKDGYEFLGWSKSKNGAVVEVADTAITSNTQFYAVFEKEAEPEPEPEPEVYDVTFYVDDEEFDKQSIEKGSFAQKPSDPSKDGYIFLGWSKSKNGTVVEVEDVAITSDTKFYAVFEEEEEEIVFYRVVFWLDGEEYKVFEEVASGDKLNAPADPKLEEGQSFLGWSLNKNGDEDDVVEVSSVVINKDTDFYAVIAENPNDPELIGMLMRGKTQLSSLRASGLQDDARDILVECMGYVIDDANAGEYIDEKYIRKHYGDMVDDVSFIVNEEMTSTERSNFVNLLKGDKIDDDVRTFLIDYFEIDMNI